MDVRLTDGIVLTGTLIEGEPVFARGDAYSVIVQEATSTKGPTFIGIPYASVVRSVVLRV
ncbi:MAG: hypothetical protein WAK11_02495 [Candidatus Cybelea sp.]